uniref:Protein MEMO1 n=1 Tax=Globodera rostochiensis TaxID=31243 RepID=A0A914HGL5_GLORO
MDVRSFGASHFQRPSIVAIVFVCVRAFLRKIRVFAAAKRQYEFRAFNGCGGAVDAGRTRPASHAGSWYPESAKGLERQLSTWLNAAGPTIGAARAIISPHAGYTYCGEAAAFAFKQIVPDKIKRIFVLGPSHVVYLSGCALTTCSKYATPLGDLYVDSAVNEQLRSVNGADSFEWMSVRNEEAEHSLEMQMPFIAKVMESRPLNSFRIVPVLVGSLSTSRQQFYGRRFRYTPIEPNSARPIHEQIASLDQQGMDAISTLDPAIFNDYLKKTQNTICGRNPICVMLQAAEYFRQMNNHTAELRFLKYAQSNKCRSMSDSSVSYASGALFISPRS